MTKEEFVYIEALNMLGTGCNPPVVQEILDQDHAKADPAWWVKAQQERQEREAACTA